MQVYEKLAVSSVIGVAALSLFLFMKRRKKKRMVLSEERYVPSRVFSAHNIAAENATSTNGPGDASTYSHPEGPNIGPGSGASWLKLDAEYPEKTDLLHTGHSKGGKLLIVTVGLPGRGKTYISRKVARYLRWINYRTRVFALAKYRQDKMGQMNADFFDFTNQANVTARNELLMSALDDAMRYLNKGGEVAIIDGTNSTLSRRQLVRERVAQEDGFNVLWIESISEEPGIVSQNEEEVKQSPDFVAMEDFQRRVDFYRRSYETLQGTEGSYVKVWDGGARLEVRDIHGFLPTKVVSLLMNLHTVPRPIYLTRHGESMFNVRDLIGGDPELSQKGSMYAQALGEYIAHQTDMPEDQLCVWSSTLRRARMTAKCIKCAKYVEWRALREIEVGVCDGLTYEQVKLKFPEEYRAREQDKLRYRYPRGESYLDIISRLEPVIFELERQQAPLVIVAHQAVLRCLYAYFLDLPADEVPFLSIPLHTLIRVEPRAYGCKEKRIKILVEEDK